jgi:hypothetical protein
MSFWMGALSLKVINSPAMTRRQQDRLMAAATCQVVMQVMGEKMKRLLTAQLMTARQTMYLQLWQVMLTQGKAVQETAAMMMTRMKLLLLLLLPEAQRLLLLLLLTTSG